MNKKEMIEAIVKRIKEIDEESLDTTDANNMIDYLLAKICEKGEDNIDFEAVEYLEFVREKLKQSIYPEKVASIKEILVSNENAANHNKFHAMKIKSNEFLKKYDEIITRIQRIMRLLIEREKQDLKNQVEER